MKIYIISISETCDGYECAHDPVPFLSSREAKKEFRRIVKLAAEAYGKKFNESRKDKNSFSIWLRDDYLRNHYRIKLTESVIAPKYGLNTVFGERAAREAEEIGYRKCNKCIEKGEFDGSAGTVEFDTAEDRDKAIELVEKADGWLGTYWEKTKPYE